MESRAFHGDVVVVEKPYSNNSGSITTYANMGELNNVIMNSTPLFILMNHVKIRLTGMTVADLGQFEEMVQEEFDRRAIQRLQEAR